MEKQVASLFGQLFARLKASSGSFLFHVVRRLHTERAGFDSLPRRSLYAEN